MKLAARLCAVCAGNGPEKLLVGNDLKDFANDETAVDNGRIKGRMQMLSKIGPALYSQLEESRQAEILQTLKLMFKEQIKKIFSLFLLE